MASFNQKKYSLLAKPDQTKLVVGDSKEEKHLTINGGGVGRRVDQLQIKFTTRMEKLMNVFYKQKGLQGNSLRMVLDVTRIQPGDTAESLAGGHGWGRDRGVQCTVYRVQCTVVG